MKRFSIGTVAIALSLAACVALTACARDDSDNPATGDRSGLWVRVDHLTGCEYLVAPEGGITLRREADGTQVCRGVAR